VRVRRGGVELEVEEHGAGPRPFVLVHGFTGSRDDFREMLPRLAARGRTLALDLRGHGGSTNTGDPAGYDLDTLRDDVLAVLDAVGAPRCDLLGHSMGGMVALRLVLAAPERVASLVLMDTAPGPVDRAARRFFEVGAKIARESGMEALAALARAAAERDPGRPPSVRRTIERIGPDAWWPRQRAKLAAMDPVAFETLGLALTDHASAEERLGEIRCPTLVLVGSEDAPFLAPSARMARAIPGAHHVVIEGAAHSPQLESPEAWLDAVLGHLERARRA
jgi:2-succinyl-6-hydroxy-2,4-cyclohexadiene-1-carboxylate synthase